MLVRSDMNDIIPRGLGYFVYNPVKENNMSIEGMRTLVWRTMSRDDTYQSRMLGEERSELLTEFDLTEEERRAILAIRTRNLSEFYTALMILTSQPLQNP